MQRRDASDHGSDASIQRRDASDHGSDASIQRRHVSHDGIDIAMHHHHVSQVRDNRDEVMRALMVEIGKRAEVHP